MSVAFFIFIVSITIPFDIRDVTLDEVSKKTIPQLIGINSAVYLSIGLLVLSQVLLQLLLPFNLGIWMFTLLGIIVLYQSKFKQPELFFSGIIDGLFIMQIGLLSIFYS
jgi:4-hydroxybenzoate polyprenyltransferase